MEKLIERLRTMNLMECDLAADALEALTQKCARYKAHAELNAASVDALIKELAAKEAQILELREALLYERSLYLEAGSDMDERGVEALTPKPSTEYLKAWLGEPVAWNWELENSVFNRLCDAGITSDSPLYREAQLRQVQQANEANSERYLEAIYKLGELSEQVSMLREALESIAIYACGEASHQYMAIEALEALAATEPKGE